MILMTIMLMKFGNMEGYAVIPEFRMSTQIEDYKRTDNSIELDMFGVRCKSKLQNSSADEFYEILQHRLHEKL